MYISEILRQPYPLFSFPEAMKRDVFFGLFLSLFLMVFTPFGLSVFAYDRFYIILGYGLVSYGTITMNDLIGYKLTPKIFNETSWKVYHQILWGIWHLILLGLANLTYGFLVGAFPLTVYSFFKIEFYVFASAIIPVMGITILRQNYLLKQNLHQAADINRDIQENKSHPPEKKPDNHLVKFVAENNKDYFEVQSSSIISISSQDNYVEFIFKKDNKVQKVLLRSALGRIEEMLSGHSDFFRCHRAFIINLNKIKSVEGNSQGYRIQMEEISEPIPVARPKNKVLKTLIHSLNKEAAVHLG